MHSFRSDILTLVDAEWPLRLVELWCELRPRVVVLPGGRTPRHIYPVLLKARDRLALDSTEFFFSDERCVPPSHRASNFGAAYRAFFGRLLATVHRFSSERCAGEAYEAALRRRQIDLALLGIGEDGHTASLFPGSEACRATDPEAPLVLSVSGPDWPRLTLTPAALNSASVVVFLASGSKKARVVQGLARRDPSLVASAIVGKKFTYILCDPAAGSDIGS